MGRKEINKMAIRELRNEKVHINTSIFAMLVLSIPLGVVCAWAISTGFNHWIIASILCCYIAIMVYWNIKRKIIQKRIDFLVDLELAIKEATKSNKIIPISKSERYRRNLDTKNLKAR